MFSKLIKRHLLQFIVIEALLMFWSAPSIADTDIQPSKTWLIAIGVQDYQKVPALKYTSADAIGLAENLATRGGVPWNQIKVCAKGAWSHSENHSTRRLEGAELTSPELRNQLERFVHKPTSDDSLIVFFSGHGFRDDQGELHLAGVDFDPRNPARQSVPVTWLRGILGQCPARTKLLILDSCHAGVDSTQSSSQVLSENWFEGVEGVITIASCKGNEKSLLWNEKQQSLFSHWLIRGLSGNADADLSGSIDIEELYRYVHRRVKHSAKKLFDRSQTPVRIVRGGVEGTPTVIRLRPQSIRTVMKDIAEEISYGLDEHGIHKTGVLEFIHRGASGEQLGGDYGLLGKYCAEELTKQIRDIEPRRFQLVDRRRLCSLASEIGFSVSSLDSTNHLERIKESGHGLSSLVVGTFLGRMGNQLSLYCNVQLTGSDTDVGIAAGGTVSMTEEDWALLGRSGIVQVRFRQGRAEPGQSQEEAVAANVIQRLDEQSSNNHSHPMLSPTWPYEVQLRVKGQIRKGRFSGNKYFVPMKMGERYSIEIDNRSGEVVMAKVLVDGLCTLPLSEPLEAGSTKGIAMEAWGQHVQLADARAYILDPKANRQKSSRFGIFGFATKTGKDGKVREFEIGSVQQSLAARQGFSDDVGLITVAFFKAESQSQGARRQASNAGFASAGQGNAIGTIAGREVQHDLDVRSEHRSGEMLGVVHLHYLDADSPIFQPR